MAATKTKKPPSRKTEDDVLAAAMARVQADNGADEVETKQTATQINAKPKTKKADGKTHTITYVPRPGDDAFTVWFGMKFAANVPRETTNPEMIELAKTNPWFSLDGAKPVARKLPPKPDAELSLENRSGLPNGADPEKYEIEAADVD